MALPQWAAQRLGYDAERNGTDIDAAMGPSRPVMPGRIRGVSQRQAAGARQAYRNRTSLGPVRDGGAYDDDTLAARRAIDRQVGLENYALARRGLGVQTSSTTTPLRDGTSTTATTSNIVPKAIVPASNVPQNVPRGTIEGMSFKDWKAKNKNDATATGSGTISPRQAIPKEEYAPKAPVMRPVDDGSATVAANDLDRKRKLAIRLGFAKDPVLEARKSRNLALVASHNAADKAAGVTNYDLLGPDGRPRVKKTA